MVTLIGFLLFLIWIITVFIFVFSCLIVLKNIYSFIKILVLKEGQMQHDNKTQLYFALALTYIITFLIFI